MTRIYILDTDVLNHLQYGNRRVIEHLQQIPSGRLFITVITEIERLRGRFQQLLTATSEKDLLEAQARLDETKRFLSQRSVLPIDAHAAAQFRRLRSLSGLRRVGRADLLIASIALAHQATLVTRNIRDFRKVPGLRLEDWTI
jgi:tRNA(fMet)-specific endonuclease VapC